MCKECNKCKQLKPLKDFYKDTTKKDGFGYTCKTCALNLIKTLYYQKNKKDRTLYYHKNREKIRKKQKEYEIKTRTKRRKYFRVWEKNKLKNDPIYKIRKYIGNRLRSALKRQRKNQSILDICGIGLEAVRIHIEKQFKEGMSWDNYGKWHIDHIIPISSFDLSDERELKKACHYSNLQPLWAEENLKKSNRIL